MVGKASALGQARSSCLITEGRGSRQIAETGIESISFWCGMMNAAICAALSLGVLIDSCKLERGDCFNDAGGRSPGLATVSHRRQPMIAR